MLISASSTGWKKYGYGFGASVPSSPINLSKLDWHINQQKRTLIKTHPRVLKNVQLRAGHITNLRPDFKHKIPTSAQWEEPSEIRVLKEFNTPVLKTAAKVHYFAGGFTALMQAYHKLEELGPDSPEQVIYVNDGKIPKTLQSGHQGHVHPTEWASENCSIRNLFRTMLEGVGILNPADPNDLENYSYLHFPISPLEAIRNPVEFIKLYGGFFKERIKHNHYSVNGVSNLDKWLCEGIRKSLDVHEKLSDKIKAKTGLPTFKRGFRVYCSTNLEQLKEKQRSWKELDIDTELMNEEEVKKYTLLRSDKIHVLKVHGDGNFFPETPERILNYMLEVFPNFSYKTACLEELHLDKSNKPSHVVQVNPQTKKQKKIAITTFFCSPGHNKVVMTDPITQAKKPLAKEMPVSGVSTLWECIISKKEMEQRQGKSLNKDDLLEAAEKIVASANLCNLHITPFSAEISPDGRSVILTVRGTQGANFNRTVASINDLRNMCANLNEFYIGEWDLLSVGTCTRKTGLKNAPEYMHPLGFLFNLSGIGYSFSGVPPDFLMQPQYNNE